MDHPNVDWVDVLGHFLDGDNKTVVSHASHPDVGSHVMSNEMPISDSIPNPVSRCVTQALVSPNVAPTNSKPEDSKPEEQKLTAVEKACIRSERKRSREKQRRSDVNTQFTDLTALLKKIEAEDVQSDETRKAFTTELSTASSNNMNRVDLIGKTISVLDRIHSENSKRKRTIDELNEELRVTKKRAEEAVSKLQQQQQSNPSGGEQSNPMMMMVPMMIRPDGTTQAPFMPQSMPYYPMCQPNTSDKASVPASANYGSMYNPFMFGKQCNVPQQPTSESLNISSKESSGPSTQEYAPTMAQAQVGNNGESLAHCA